MFYGAICSLPFPPICVTEGGRMGTFVTCLLAIHCFGSLTLDSLQGTWTVAVRLDNICRTQTSLEASTYADYDPYYEDAMGAAYLYTTQTASCGFPTDYSILWRVRKDAAIGLDGSVSYERLPGGRYEYRTQGYSRELEYSRTRWDVSLGLEMYKYMKRNTFIAPFASFGPFVRGTDSEYWRTGVVCTEDDTTSFGDRSTSKMRTYGIDLNWGADLLFRLSTAKMSLRMKATLCKLWTSRREQLYTQGQTLEENPWGVDLYLPTQSEFTLWLCFYF
ncbi:hypothetical protein AMJ40_03185 [candidate division TA06 bacterium DG_26]|uniref:Uncharacterized protein n=1 Tax=candidate division TA06 bacterium DG_26 TaxID=1703771 RepID=A0A0S7WJU6_UNCT6|nr:MAG: hypothetical protein AMJ40_03185 [candidate division TA06 bacterium DG_26]